MITLEPICGSGVSSKRFFVGVDLLIKSCLDSWTNASNPTETLATQAIFHSTFWAFLWISQAPLGRSLWSGYHWRDLFLLQKLSIDDANFGQGWWHQKWKKGQGSSQPVTPATGVSGLNKYKRKVKFFGDALSGGSAGRNFIFSTNIYHVLAFWNWTFSFGNKS